MRKLALKSGVVDFLSTLPPKQFRQVLNKILALMENPTPNDFSALQGYEAHRVDSGEYRIIYRFDCEAVTIIIVGKRNDDEVYRRLKRL